jgi:hypothetical protein
MQPQLLQFRPLPQRLFLLRSRLLPWFPLLLMSQLLQL